MRTIVAGVAMMMLGTSALAQTASETAVAATAPKDQAKICRRIEQTGSRVGSKRVCHTADEWQAIDAAAGENGSGSNLRSKTN